jgi:hypothetical protein
MDVCSLRQQQTTEAVVATANFETSKAAGSGSDRLGVGRILDVASVSLYRLITLMYSGY